MPELLKIQQWIILQYELPFPYTNCQYPTCGAIPVPGNICQLGEWEIGSHTVTTATGCIRFAKIRPSIESNVAWTYSSCCIIILPRHQREAATCNGAESNQRRPLPFGIVNQSCLYSLRVCNTREISNQLISIHVTRINYHYHTLHVHLQYITRFWEKIWHLRG